MFKNPLLKNIVSALAVAVFGFVLLNITFLLYFLVFRFIDILVPRGSGPPGPGFPLIRLAVFLVIIGLISWPVFRSKLSVLFKAIYMTVPVAVFLVTIGIAFNRWPLVPYLIGGLSLAALLFFFYRTRQPWLYYYSVILVALALAIFTLLGGEI